GRNGKDEGGVHEDDQRHHDRREHGGDPESLEAHPPHPTQEPLVLLGGDLVRVPYAPARSTGPRFSVSDFPALAAVAGDRDRGLLHLYPIVRRSPHCGFGVSWA